MSFPVPVLAAALGLALAALPVLSVWLLHALASDALRAALRALLLEHAPLIALLLLATALLSAWVAGLALQRRRRAVLRLAERVQMLAHGVPGRQADAADAEPLLAPVLGALDNLAAVQGRLSADWQRSLALAREDSERERTRLAAFMETLPQALLVCNAEGRILLYNHIASRLFAGTGWLGLGRDVSALVGAAHLAHVREHFAAADGGDSLSFTISTGAGRLLRVRVAALREPGAVDAAPGLIGLMLTAEDITQEAMLAARRQRALQALGEQQQAGLALLRQEARQLADEVSTLPEAVRASATALGVQADALASQMRQTLADELAALQASSLRSDMRGSDLLRAAQRRIESRLGLTVHRAEPDAALILPVDSFLLVQALSFLATRVWESCEPRSLQLSLVEEGGLLRLQLEWAGTALSYESALGWELEGMNLAGEASTLSVREVARHHAGELRFERERAATRSRFVFLLPPGSGLPPEREVLRREAVAYDFALFTRPVATHTQAGSPLSELAFTVFDTETTGLDPAGGDEIIQIGAVRILHGKLLRDERFVQLVDPQRAISPASQRIHGISREALRGQPHIAEVLPRFHAFVGDSVLVGHNAAFDMRFLQLKEAATGLRFDHPVLDTLLLSSLLHPNQASHSLEAIAERLGVGVFDRHDALADATMTAQIFLRLIPLLAERGIHTLADAREASLRSPHAQLQY